MKKTAIRHERLELLEQVQAILEPAMAALGLLFLGLLLIDYTATGLSARNHARLDTALQIIWAIFVLDFAVRFIIAPAKGSFLRQNWFGALSLALPFLRPFRVLRAARVLRSLSLVRLLGGINRGMRVLRRLARGRQVAYVAGLTLLVVLGGAAGVLYFDRAIDDAPIQSFGDALWWSAAMVTTINNEKYAVSTEARVIAILVRVFAVSVFGFVTASIASYLIGRPDMAEDERNLRDEIDALRRELALVRDVLVTSPAVPAQRDHQASGPADGTHATRASP
ncbi:MAG: ion transporter [Chloroflexia bacterium]|nr:ion transporter [Chloroflexia bacterium]